MCWRIFAMPVIWSRIIFYVRRHASVRVARGPSAPVRLLLPRRACSPYTNLPDQAFSALNIFGSAARKECFGS